MKKALAVLLLAGAALVGCQRGDQGVNEPAGANRDYNAGSSSTTETNTNSISEPSGANSGQINTNTNGNSATQNP